MKLRYTRTALREIDKALSYTSERSPQGAAALRQRILTAVDLIRDHAQAGQMTSRRDFRRVVLSPYPYVLFYRVAADEIVVARFRHAARKPLSES
ncbi:type II toxin-antitoxin system RelE/ParE family toxin [Fulvimarina sp. MAC8]|uniref:type II toxin-antitoxin system RelE/ParE family toxin n=1 Tax=Fulvimarina sp. MAC8 TaxID=3162874 RepID=UPI0032F0713A